MTRAVETEAYFTSAIRTSDRAVFVVASHLRNKGNIVEIVLKPVGRFYSDDGDIVILPKRQIVEVKWRQIYFHSAATYPYDTIFLDRTSKRPADLIVIVNNDLTHAAFIKQSSRFLWREVETFDNNKRCFVRMLACPLKGAVFTKLEP